MNQVLSLLLAFESMTRKGHEALLSRMSKPAGPARPAVRIAEKVGSPVDRDFRFPQIDAFEPHLPAELTPGAAAGTETSGRSAR